MLLKISYPFEGPGVKADGVGLTGFGVEWNFGTISERVGKVSFDFCCCCSRKLPKNVNKVLIFEPSKKSWNWIIP